MSEKKTLTAIERLDKEYAEKRAELERNLALAAKLPTHGKTFTWIGDGGYVGNDKQPDKEKSAPLDPWIFHSAFRGAQHVAYRPPEEYPDYGPLAAPMRRAYVQAVCDAYAPLLVDILAVKGTYASNVPATFDYKAHRDYHDAKEVARGRAELTVSTSMEYNTNDAQLEFYADVPGAGPVQVSIKVPRPYKLAPRPVGVSRYSQHGPVSHVDRWDIPPHGAVHTWRRGSGDHRNTNCTVEYLYATVADALADIFGEG